MNKSFDVISRIILYSLQAILFIVVSYFVFVFFLGGATQNAEGDLIYGYPYQYQIASRAMTDWYNTYFSFGKFTADMFCGLIFLTALGYLTIQFHVFLAGLNKRKLPQ